MKIFDGFLQRILPMRHLASLEGTRGRITICEDKNTGERFYYERGILQAHATPQGISMLSYIHLMNGLLSEAKTVLLLGCGSGSLATMLQRQGKQVTLVDDNNLSFEIAHLFFGLPAGVATVVADCVEYLLDEGDSFDAVGIDIGGPFVEFEERIDARLCQSIGARLNREGRVVMNMVSGNLDTGPDRILTLLTSQNLTGWVYEQPNKAERNAILYAAPETYSPKAHPLQPFEEVQLNSYDWICRGSRTVPTTPAGTPQIARARGRMPARASI
jgi:SAM-dependent methyltransferase